MVRADTNHLRTVSASSEHASGPVVPITGLDALAASLTTLEGPYALHGLLQTGLAAMPRNYSALIWSLVQVVTKLEKET